MAKGNRKGASWVSAEDRVHNNAWQPHMYNYSFMCRAELADQAKRLADEMGITFGELLRRLMQDALKGTRLNDEERSHPKDS